MLTFDRPFCLTSRAAVQSLLLLVCAARVVVAQDVSAPAFLQVFEAKWDVVDDRMADIFVAGYGRLWLPPPARADSGNQSVGYDVYDRFDLGQPRNETLYGTETGLKNLISQAHTAGIKVNTDYIANHNGFSDSSTFDNYGTPEDPSDDITFVEAGGYPGFVLTLPGDVDGDFHGAFEEGEEYFRLSGLIDIAQEKNHQFIRNPVEVGNPANIPAGTTGIYGRPPANVPDANNARFYPDQDLGGTGVFDPAIGQNITLYDFNTATPLAGDAVSENATGLLIRNIRWMIQEVGVDGFRFDAGRHFPRWVMNYLDQGAFLAKQETLLDGSPDHVFSFTEVGFDSHAFQADFIRKDIDDNNLGQVGGNRDALDFNLFGAIKENLTGNGFDNDWRNIKNASIDIEDDAFANNGSQGVAFSQSHDDGPAYLNNVAHAYMLMRPGNALVYFNADQFDDPLRAFPEGGRGDALGGMFGDRVTTLVNLRNTHGRGNYIDRTPGGDEKEILVYEREKSALVVLSNRLDGGYDSRTVQTAFAPGTPLIELSGNAADATIDPFNDFPEVLVVKSDGTVDLRVPRNSAPDGTEHGSGYLIYGVSGPQGQMRLTNTAGNDLTSVLAGHTPTPGEGGAGGPSDNTLNGTTRLSDITVVQDPSFKLRIETTAVNLLGSIRDRHADGDFAQFRIDGGLDANGNGFVDEVASGSVAYAFENFTETNSPGFFNSSGDGLYEQTIDATQLSEGRHYLTGRVYRHRNPNTTTDNDPSTAGDGGPAVFTEFRQVIYVDLLPPEAEVVSFEPFASNPGETQNRDLVVRSVDKTADNMHVFLDLPANLTDAQIVQMALSGQNDAGQYDVDSWIFGFTAATLGNGLGVTTGNHVATVVTFEPTYDGTRGINVQRFAGLLTNTTAGAGFGDLDHDNQLEVSDLSGVGGFEQILESGNSQFSAAADVTGDGLVDNRDLLALVDELLLASAPTSVLDELEQVLLRQADLNNSGSTDLDDLVLLYANLGAGAGPFDLNVDGVTDLADVETFIEQMVRTVAADMNLDGVVNIADYTLWRNSQGSTTGIGDANLDGVVDSADYSLWRSQFGFMRQSLASTPAAAVAAVPEPRSLVAMLMGCIALAWGKRFNDFINSL